MNTNFFQQEGVVHLWHAWLPDFFGYESEYFQLLSSDEITRAQRFHFPLHRQRYVISRGILRLLLSRYLQREDIVFSYGPKGKPYLQDTTLRFNVSHSENIAIFVLTVSSEIGVDIEKMEDKDHDNLAKRFFSPEENKVLSTLNPEEHRIAFYKIWSAKEAIIKAMGAGLWIPLNEFSVSPTESKQTLFFSHQHFYLENSCIHPDYQTHVAMMQPIRSLQVFEYKNRGLF